jgi:hypothetical protein
MARKQKQQVASWYWNVSAILTPFVLIAGLVMMYYQHQVEAFAKESDRIYRQVRANHDDFKRGQLVAQMGQVATEIGFGMAGVLDGVGNIQPGEVPRSIRTSVVTPEDLTAPDEKKGFVLVRYLQTDKEFFGEGSGATGMVHEYAAARHWLREFDSRVRRYLAFKSFQYYTVHTIEIQGGEAAVAEGDLRRPVTVRDNIPQPDAAAIEGAWARQQEQRQPPADRTMQPPVEFTLELVFRRQMQLMVDLARVNHHQHSLLYADVSGGTGATTPDGRPIRVGTAGETDQLDSIKARLQVLSRRVDERTNSSTTALDNAYRTTDQAIIETVQRINDINNITISGTARLEDLASQFSGELYAHQADAGRFEDLIRGMPRIKSLIRLDKPVSDGEVTYSDYTRRVCHINLGSADGVKAGQRFEIWRTHGRDQDRFVGVVEVVRTLSAHFSLCSVIALTDSSDPVRKNDTLVTRIWSGGRFLTVALHGEFEPPNQVYTKERLTELLTLAGCRVVDRVQPGVDLVVLGSNLFSDSWYREARNDLRFDTIREEEIRLYVDAR